MIVTDLSNKEKRKAYGKQYRLNNKEKIREYKKQYNLEHKKEKAQYRLDNKKVIKEVQDTRLNTEEGYLKMRYGDLRTTAKKAGDLYLTWKEFWTLWTKHKSIYGMKSAWGLGSIENGFEGHETMTMIYRGKDGHKKGSKRILTNMGPDGIDSNLGHIKENIHFITYKENARKKDTSYKDCLIQIKLTDERFK